MELKPLVIRKVTNGYVCHYGEDEMVFPDLDKLFAWMIDIWGPVLLKFEDAANG